MSSQRLHWLAPLALLCAMPALAQQVMPPASVAVESASEQTMASTFLAPGTIVSRNDARVSAEIAGRLVWVAEVGTAVVEGDVIARIEDREWRLRLQENDAEIRRLEANRKYLATQLERFERLAAQNNAALTQIDEARSQIEMAKQDIVRAKVDRERTRFQLERTEVRALFPGRVTERFANIGEYMSVGGELLRLVDTTNVEVRAQAPVSVARYLVDGMPVAVRDDRGSSESVIRSVVGVGDERSRMIEVRVALDGPAWIIGSAVRVELPQSEPAIVVAVPRDALILRENSTYLYKVMEDNTVEQVPVRTGAGSGRFIEVRGDISNGDRVVVRGGERLRPGQSVVVTSDNAA